jgi:hypothetical protein
MDGWTSTKKATKLMKTIKNIIALNALFMLFLIDTVVFKYYGKKEEKVYSSTTTNPLFMTLL